MSTNTSGLSGANILNGTDTGEKLVGGGGNDTIDGGGGSDFINAGGGNDIIIYDEADYKILGGGGVDTLWFTKGGQQLRLGSGVVSGIEKLLLGGEGFHQVWLSAADVIRVSDNDRMMISGAGNDQLWLTDDGWQFEGLTGDGEFQVFGNGLAKIIVALPVHVSGFSNNASIIPNGPLAVTEDSATPMLRTTGTLLVNDPNEGQALLLGGDQTYTAIGSLKVTLTVPPSTGALTVYEFEYVVDNADVKYLSSGQTKTDTFTISSLDGTTKNVSFTIYGVTDEISGSPGNDILNGTEGDDIILGLAGHDYIDGGMGGDIMVGGAGNDTYIVDSVSDSVRELEDEGVDSVQSSVSYTLPDNVENLELVGNSSINAIGNDLPNTIIGNDGNNIIYGHGGDDYIKDTVGNAIIYGGDGSDTIERGPASSGSMFGESGNDKFIFYPSANNLVLYGGSGSDVFHLMSYATLVNSKTIIPGFELGAPNGSTGDIIELPGDVSLYSMRASSLFNATELVGPNGNTLITIGVTGSPDTLMATMISQGNIIFYGMT